MLTVARISRRFGAFVVLAVALGALAGDAVTAAGMALFVVLLACLDPKPAWKWFYDPPGSVDSGRASGRFFSWRRFSAGSPRERLPRVSH